MLLLFRHSCLHAYRSCKYNKRPAEEKNIHREVARVFLLVTPTFSSHESSLEETQKLSANPSVEPRNPSSPAHSRVLLFQCCSAAYRATLTFMPQAHLLANAASLLCFSGPPILQFTTAQQLTVVETRTLDHRKEVHALATSSTALDISGVGETFPRLGCISLDSCFRAVRLLVALAFIAR